MGFVGRKAICGTRAVKGKRGDAMSGRSEARFLIPILSAANFVIGMGAFMVIGLLEPMADGLALSTAAAGWVMTSYAVAYAVLSPVLVSVTGGLGRRRVMALGLMLFALGCALSALAPAPATLFAARMVAAAGAGLFTPVAAAVAAATSAPDRQGKALAAVFFGLTLAQVFGVPAGGWVAYTFGWRSAFWMVVALAVPCIWLIWTGVPRGLRFQPVSLRALGRVLADGPAMLGIAFTTSFIGAIYVIYTYLSPLLGQTMGWGRDGIVLALIVCGFGAVAGNLIGGAVSDRIGAGRTLTILAVSQVLIMPLFSLLPMLSGLVLGLLLLWTSFGWSFQAAQQMRLLSIAPQAAGVILALNAAAIYVGTAVGSALGGAVLSGFGLEALGIGGGLAAILAVALLLWSRRVSGG